MKNLKFKPYKKEFEYSYSLGLFPTIELMHYQQEHVEALVFSQSAEKSDAANTLKRLCHNAGIPVTIDDKHLASLGKNGNNLVAGVFSKYASMLSASESHVVLVEPDDMGNIGTIVRSMLGFGYRDLAIIGQAADYWHPKCIRSSMGALFRQRVALFSTIEEYQLSFPKHTIYPFIVNDNAQKLSGVSFSTPHSLVFGNEGAGLPQKFSHIGMPVFIEQEPEIDSLNLATSASIAMYSIYTKRNRSL
jgi:TrmH family RNA methyltransferase